MTKRRPIRRFEGVLPEPPVVGAVLLAIAAIVLLGSVVPELERYRVLTIAAVCLVGFALTREYGLAIPAGVVAGGGTGLLFMTGADPAGAGYFLLAIAAGFAGVWLLGHRAAPPERHPWPLIPAAVIGLVGGSIAIGRPELINWVFIGGAVLAAVIGLALVVRRTGSGRSAGVSEE